MSAIKGFTFGLLVGFAAGAAISERQRRDAAERIAALARRRSEPIADSVVDNMSKVADAATDVITDHIDEAGDAVSDQLESTAPSSAS